MGYSRRRMRSRARKVNTPTALDDAIEQRLKELPYESFSEYVNGLIFYDLATRKPHTVTGEMSRFSRTEVDRMHDALAEAFEKGETLGGSWFEHITKEAASAVAKGEDLPKSRLARELLKRMKP